MALVVCIGRQYFDVGELTYSADLYYFDVGELYCSHHVLSRWIS